MRPRYLVGLLTLIACGSAARSGDTLSNTTRSPPGVLTITTERCGPIDGKAKATLGAMRELFSAYDVKPENVDNTLQFHVFRGGELMLYVVPGDEGTVFNVQATSNKVSVADRSWRVGEAFSGAAQLTACECWGPNPTCFKKGDHIAVNFNRGCEGLTGADPRALKVLDGVRVQRVIWSPSPFGMDDDPPEHRDAGGDPSDGSGGADPSGQGTGDPDDDS